MKHTINKFKNLLKFIFIFYIFEKNCFSFETSNVYSIDTQKKYQYISNSRNIHKQKRNELVSRESFNEVSAYAMTFFTHRCNLALQNCLFQTQWEQIFKNKNIKTLSSHKNNENRLTRHSISSKQIQKTFNSNFSSYHYCKAFLVAKFCVDDYLKKSEYHAECVNGSTAGNVANEFKRSIYRKECKLFYSYFFDASIHQNGAKIHQLNLSVFCSIYLLHFILIFFY